MIQVNQNGYLKPPRKITHHDFIREAKEEVNNISHGKPPRKDKSKKRKFASQPRATKIKRGKKGNELPGLAELPDRRTKGQPKAEMTFFNEKGFVIPREMNNIKIVQRNHSGRRSASSIRSISQHSNNSRRTFRATHKRPSMT